MEIGTPDIFIYGGFMFLMVYSYTTLMDKSESALWIELGKSILGLAIIYFSGDWFGLSEWIPGGLILVVSYFLISAAVVAYFVINEIKIENKVVHLEEVQ